MSKYRLPPWPSGEGDSRSDIFFEVLAECFRADRPDLAARFKQFAEEFTTPASREKRRLAQRDGLIREVVEKHYPTSLGANVRARLVAGDLEAMFQAYEDDGQVSPRPQNLMLREILELNGDNIKGLGFENVKIILRRAG